MILNHAMLGVPDFDDLLYLLVVFVLPLLGWLLRKIRGGPEQVEVEVEQATPPADEQRTKRQPVGEPMTRGTSGRTTPEAGAGSKKPPRIPIAAPVAAGAHVSTPPPIVAQPASGRAPVLRGSTGPSRPPVARSPFEIPRQGEAKPMPVFHVAAPTQIAHVAEKLEKVPLVTRIGDSPQQGRRADKPFPPLSALSQDMRPPSLPVSAAARAALNRLQAAQTQSLQEAFLLAEILGKPVALRDLPSA